MQPCYQTERGLSSAPWRWVTSIERLAKDLAVEVGPVYVVLGEAQPLVDRALSVLRDAVAPEIEPAAFNHNRFRGGDLTGVEPFATARTLPMVARRRLVEVRGAEEAPGAMWAGLVAYLASPAPEAVVVIAGTRFPKVEKGGSNWSARVKNALKKSDGTLVTLGGRDAQPEEFAIDAAAKRGKTLGRRQAQLLVQVVGADLGRLEQEVEKLTLFVGDEEIGQDAIEAAGSMLAEAVIWDLTTALAVRDADGALVALHRLQAGGDDARKLLGMITWQVRELLRAAELLDRGVPFRDLGKHVKLRYDMLKRVRPVLTTGFPPAAELLRRIATANRQMNSHRAGADRILEGLVLELLEGRIRRPPPVPRPRYR